MLVVFLKIIRLMIFFEIYQLNFIDRYSIILYYIKLYYIILYYIILYHIILYYIILYYYIESNLHKQLNLKLDYRLIN